MNFINDLVKFKIFFFISILSGGLNCSIFTQNIQTFANLNAKLFIFQNDLAPAFSDIIIGNDSLHSLKKHHIFINSIISGIDTLFNGIMLPSSEADNARLSFSYKHRDLRFLMSTDDYEKSPVNYRLETNNKKLTSNLQNGSDEIQVNFRRSGSYVITFNSLNPSLLTSGKLELEITILKPAWLNSWLIFFYISAVLVLAFISYKHLIFRYLLTSPSRASGIISDVPYIDPGGPPGSAETSRPVPSDKSKWEKFDMITVLFSDIQGFTKIAEQMNPEKLIDELDKFFFHFDSVCEKYNIEKIKTIGDAYMAAGGIPRQNSTNPIQVVLAALEMQRYMKQLRNTRVDIWDLRIGIHSGPVIGGVIGHKKRSYDIWGDTVNTASRMESSGEPGKVNISGITYSLIKDYFICNYRGRLPVKYKGNIDMYFVKGLRPELSINLGQLPNRLFFLRLQHLRLKDIEKEIFLKADTEVSSGYTFHNPDYVRYLYRHASLLSKSESLSVEDDLLVKTSVLLLFTGITSSYENYQNSSANYAQEILPEYNYNDKQVMAVYNLILFAKLRNKPRTIPECIIHDVLTDYLGRKNYPVLSKLLFSEQNEKLAGINKDEWVKQQILLLKEHQFYTNTAKSLREISAEEQIINLRLEFPD